MVMAWSSVLNSALHKSSNWKLTSTFWMIVGKRVLLHVSRDTWSISTAKSFSRFELKEPVSKLLFVPWKIIASLSSFFVTNFDQTQFLVFRVKYTTKSCLKSLDFEWYVPKGSCQVKRKSSACIFFAYSLLIVSHPLGNTNPSIVSPGDVIHYLWITYSTPFSFQKCWWVIKNLNCSRFGQLDSLNSSVSNPANLNFFPAHTGWQFSIGIR